MAIYVVTGKLGGGKTLGAVSRINDALAKGKRVATNLDLALENLPACNRKTKRSRVLRVPDRPSVDDIKAIGFGIEGVHDLSQAKQHYDESRFGIVVLDECGTWLNSRDWQAEGRRELINFLLHIRKHLWDVYLIIQDISMLDKQARKALAEHVIYCRRFDRIGIPFLGSLVSVFTGSKLKMPKLHMGIVKYGDQPTSITVDRWFYNGASLYRAYDTTQVFLDDYAHGLYSVLPPWYRYQHSFVNWNWRKVMQLTQVYLRQYSRTLLLAAGVFAGAVVGQSFQSDNAATPQPVEAAQGTSVFDIGVVPEILAQGVDVPLVHRLRIASIEDYGRGRSVWFTDGGMRYSEDALQAIGVEVSLVGRYRWRLQQGEDYSVIGRFD